MDSNIQSTANLKLEKAYTFFIVPFYYEKDDWNTIHKEKLNKWTPISSELYNEDVLYPYIMDLFKQQSSSHKTRLNIYEFLSEDKGIKSQLFIDRILGKTQIALIGKNTEEKTEPKTIPFKLMNEKNFAPHLFVSPSTKIGIFTFAIELLGDKQIEDLVSLNYFLHKRNETNKYQCVCFRPEKQDDVDFSISDEQIYSQIPNLWNLNQKSTRNNENYICWNLNDFVDCLLATMKEGQKRIKYFSKARMHLFTFCSMQDENDIIKKDDITPNLFRLSRCLNFTFNQLVQQNAMLQTYENIFFSSSIEGTAMMCIGKPENKAFIASIHDKFNRQYLLIYLLVLMQRYTLQSLEQKITEYESSDKQTDEGLWNLIDVICRIKTNCYYTDVSIYTHHSQFYQHCCRNLHIPETFKEIDEKVELLQLTTNKRIQEFLKQREKKTNRFWNFIKWFGLLITISSVMQGALRINTAICDDTWPVALFSGGGCFLLFLIIFLWLRYSNKS